jgi:hypothetical protein
MIIVRLLSPERSWLVGTTKVYSGVQEPTLLWNQLHSFGAVTVTWALEAAKSPTGLKHGYPPGVYVFLGSVALLSVARDIRMLARGSVSGIRRIARHLWRMCFALFIAASSIFLARQQIFPALLRKTGILFLLSILPLILMIFWLVRVSFTSAYKRKLPSGSDAMSTVR